MSLDTPKVLFPVGGKEILAHSVDAVAALKDVQEVILIGFYEDYIFRDFIARKNKQFSHLKIQYLREYKAMGTAGGLYHFRDVILRGSPSKFFVIHADVCSSFPLKEISAFFDEKKAKAVIMGTRVPAKIATNFGAIVADDNSKVVHYVEKPENKISDLVNAGVYLFDQSLFDVIAAAKSEKEQKMKDVTAFDEVDHDNLQLEQDVLVKLADTSSFYVYESKDFWRQIKEAGSALPANALYLQQLFQTDPKAPGLAAPSATIVPPVFIDPSAEVDPTAKLGPNVSIGANAKIGAGARVNDSIILDHTELLPNSVVIHSIVGSGCKVGKWARIEGVPVNYEDYAVSTLKDGVKIQNVTILASHVGVADEVHIQTSIVLPHKDIKTDVKNEVVM